MNKLKKYLLLFIVTMSLYAISLIAYGAIPIYKVGNAEGNFLQIPLTHNIYRYSQYANLQDLEVLDAEQHPLPYRLVNIIPTVTQTAPKIISNPLAFYPIAVDATPETLRKLHSTEIKTTQNSVQITTSDKTLSNKTPEFYLIDVSNISHDLTSLNIDWAAQSDNQYLEVELEATHNLTDWFELKKTTLVQISELDQNLKRNHIDVDIAKNEYEFLRLRVLRGADNLHITAITAEQKINTPNEPQQPSETWKVSGVLAKLQTTVYLPSSHSKSYPVAAWEFIRDEITPIQTLAIDFGTTTYGASVKIFSRSTESQNWQLQQQGIWFNAQVGDNWQKSSPITIYQNNDRYWRVELNESAKHNPSPTLVLGWQPSQLQLIANNKPPYILAINHVKNSAYNEDQNNNQVFTQIMSVSKPVWVPAQLIKLDVQPDVAANTYTAVDWKQWLFWGVLLLAVGVLLVLSLKLFKQFNLQKIE